MAILKQWTGNQWVPMQNNVFGARGATAALNLYLNESTGNDANNGYSAGQAVASLAEIDRIIQGIDTAMLPTPVVVNMAGTITKGHTFRNLRSHIGGLTFRGEALVNSEPVTHLTMGSGSAQFGIRLEPGTSDVTIENLKITGFRGGGNGYAFLMKEAGNFRVENVTIDDCDIGISATESVQAFAGNVTVTNCNVGMQAVYSSSATFGSSARPVTVTGCERGFHFSRNAVGHVDYALITDCTIAGVNVDMASRVHILGSDLMRNAVGVRAFGAAEWNDNPSIPNNFYHRTANANDQAVEYRGAARETRLTSQAGSNEWRSYVTVAPVSTSTGSNQALVVVGNSLVIPAYLLDVPGRSIRFVAAGQLTGTATKVLQARRTNTTGTVNNILTSLSTDAIGAFIYEATVRSTGPDEQQFSQELRVNGRPNILGQGARSEVTSGDWLLRLNGSSGDADSSITVTSFEVFLSV